MTPQQAKDKPDRQQSVILSDAPALSLEGKDLNLEDYVELKFSEFVRSMKASSATSLHATVVQAVERPLIRHALRETGGNQIQAAQLLGLHRNTLRKKIEAYGLHVERRSQSRRRRQSGSSLTDSRRDPRRNG